MKGRLHKEGVRLFFCVVLIFIPLAAEAFEIHQGDRFSLGLKGYYKNLVFETKRQATDNPMTADLNRLRTEWDAKYDNILHAKVIWDNELIGGDYVNSEGFAGREIQRNAPYGHLNYEIVHQNNFFYGQQFYRAYAELTPGPFTLTVGRQKIDWGAMHLFSPADLFSRVPIFDIEKDERVGATAANMNVPIGSSLRINPVYAFHPDFDRSRLGARVTKTLGHFDLSATGGRFLRDAAAGLDFTGDLGKAGVRGEFIYDWAVIGANFAQFAVGADYGFENTFYVALEYFYNGQGRGVGANQIQTVHQNFIGLQMKYDLTPLWMAVMETIVDVNGGSFFLNPETKYSFFSWMDVSAGAQLPVGRAGGEFTATPNVYYLQTQLFF